MFAAALQHARVEPMPSRRALLLVGHGAAHDPESGAPVRTVASCLTRMGLFREVATAFWKEGPPMREVLEALDAEEVFVVPMFLADGYYTRQVVPRELQLEARVTQRGSRRIHYCRPVGSHPTMVQVVLKRAEFALAARQVASSAAELVLAGHGTERSATSAGTVRTVALTLQSTKRFAAVRYGLLDEAPRIEDVVREAMSTCVVVVPYFLAEGWHTRRTIPERLELARQSRPQLDVLYSPPVGTSSRMSSVVLDLVASADRGELTVDERSDTVRAIRNGSDGEYR